ncbi:MAG: hypothetical protein O3A10_11830 [Chloroflexi bacterium]|nr:hypothetical protein [Chloroflexota bacterium]MDA1147208.1 hypothetical protein [Chloroflexota bacterium]
MTDPVSEARATLDRWNAAFNARDVAAQTAEMHFPHVRLTAANGFMQWATAEDFEASQAELTARLQAEGWDHTSALSVEPVQVGPDKVHFALRQSRQHADGSEYNGFDTFWIFTKIEGRWGLQFRSSFLAGSAQGFTNDVRPT